MDLSGKIGGIPVPVIGGVIGLALVAALYFRSSSKAASGTAPATVAVPDVGPGDLVDSRGTQDGGIASDVAMFVSNGTWTATALGWETATLGTSPLTVQRAISNYLDGSDLTQDEAAIINRVIGKFGLPPQGVTGISTILPKSIPLKDPPKETAIPTPTAAKTPEYTPPKVNPYSDFIGALITPAPSSTVGSSITTNYSSNTGSIYNVSLNGVSRPISDSLVWSGAFSGGKVPDGYTAAEAAAIRDQLKLKGLAS